MNCIIVDDEPLAREAIEILVKEIPYLELAGTFNNASSAAWFMDGHTVDLIFLDIQMPGITGMDFAEVPLSSSPPPTRNMPSTVTR